MGQLSWVLNVVLTGHDHTVRNAAIRCYNDLVFVLVAWLYDKFCPYMGSLWRLRS